MAQGDFALFVPVSKAFINCKKNTAKQKVEWLQIKWIRVMKEKPLQFQYRHSLNTLETWKIVDLKRKAKGRPPDLGRILLPKLYSRPREIKPGKKKDLMELLDYVPPVHHAFYHQLVAAADDNEEEEIDYEMTDESGEDSDGSNS